MFFRRNNFFIFCLQTFGFFIVLVIAGEVFTTVVYAEKSNYLVNDLSSFSGYMMGQVSISGESIAEESVVDIPTPPAEPQSKPEVIKPVSVIATSVEQNKTIDSPSPSSFTMSKIGLYNIHVSDASVMNMSQIDTQLLQGPVRESQLAHDFCTPDENTYLMGHSEPPSKGDSVFPGVRVFSNLTDMQPDDLIQTTNASGDSCTYKVTSWQNVQTGPDGQISTELFNSLFNPETSGKSLLTIQTCQKGSASVRLILHAEMVLN